jgi:ABC-type dipeptide/oligopeptide/nickel transport system permease component
VTLAVAGKRLAQAFPVLIGVTLVTFALTALIPGNVAQVLLGPRANPQQVRALATAYGLNQPLWVQYGRFLTRLAHGNLGYSLILDQNVGAAIAQRAPATLLLVAYATVLAAGLSAPLGMAAARRAGRPADHVIRLGVVTGLSLPTFWVAVMLILFVALPTHIFPVSGYGGSFPAHLWYLFLPALALALTFIAVITRSLRASALQVLKEPYVTTALAKGLSARQLMRRHVRRNALLPVVTIAGLNMAWLISGTVVVETVFAVPGLGQLLVNSVLDHDYQVVQALVLVFAVFVVLVNIATDLLYAALDPRVAV